VDIIKTIDMQQLYEERLGRYQAAIALEPTDRMPLAMGSNCFSEVYSGASIQEVTYDPERWLQVEMAFSRDYPEVDVARAYRIWPPLWDVLDLKTYRAPGRDLPPCSQVQFVEEEYMKNDEYNLLIENPGQFMLERVLPRIFGEMSKDSARSHFAFLKAGLAQGILKDQMRSIGTQLQTQCGIPGPYMGAFRAPFDVLADGLRGLKGSLLDTYRQGDKVLEACDVLVTIAARGALANADPLKRLPIFNPLHKACFMSPKQFDTYFWPSYKKLLEIIIGSGYKVRAYLEGDWSKHWHHFLELPKGTVLCDIDNQSDIFQAKAEIGHHQCISGGIQDSMLILGTPQEITARTKLLCETVGKDGGFLINGGCSIPYDTKPENFKAMVEGVMKYGWYDKSIKHKPKQMPPVKNEIPGLGPQGMITPWEIKKAELGGVLGDEQLIRNPWERIEAMAYNWVCSWH